jgi:multiple sugar transport system permease protein
MAEMTVSKQEVERKHWTLGKKEGERIGNTLTILILTIFGLTNLFPFFWMVSSSLKTLAEIYIYPPTMVPIQLMWSNYADAWNALPFGRFFLNSIIVSCAVVFGQLLTSSLAGYSFARLRYPFRNKIFLLYLATLMVPFTVILIPLYVQMRAFGWVNTLLPVIIPFIFTPWGTFLMRQFMLSIPKELEDAARIDGCSWFQVYWRIILPLCKPALATLAIFTFLTSWNSYQWPMITLGTMEVKTLPLGLAMFYQQAAIRTPWHLVMAASTFIVLPVLVVFVFGQKYYVRGVVSSGIKGGA